MSIVNLKDIVDSYAHKFFKENERDYHKIIGKNTTWNELVKEIEWKNFRIKHKDIKYHDMENPGDLKSSVVFKTTFVNDTDNEQDYQLMAERKTMSTCSFELFEGYVNEGQAELSVSVPIPGCALEAGAGFRTEYVLETTRTKSVQEEMNWNVQSNVKIPAKSQTTAELQVKEKEYKGRFEIKTYFKGDISLKLFNRDGHEVLQIDLGDIDDIFTRNLGFQRDNKGLFKMTRGTCKARFGIDQKIELHQRPV